MESGFYIQIAGIIGISEYYDGAHLSQPSYYDHCSLDSSHSLRSTAILYTRENFIVLVMP